MTAVAVVDAEVMAVEEVAVAMVEEDTEVADDFGQCFVEKSSNVYKGGRGGGGYGGGGYSGGGGYGGSFLKFSDFLSPSHKYFDP